MKLYHRKETETSNGYHHHEFMLKKVESLNWWMIPDSALAPEIKKFPADISMACANESPENSNGRLLTANSAKDKSIHHQRRHPKKWFLPENEWGH